MPKNIPSLKPKELIKLLEQAGCTFHREGKGDHCLYTREVDGKRRIVPIDIGARGMSPGYVLRIFRQSLEDMPRIEDILGMPTAAR